MNVITHRGLNFSKQNYFLESSLEAFTDQLENGFGLEFDLQLTKDNQIVVSHDSNLERISRGEKNNKISELALNEITSFNFNGCHLASFEHLLELISKKQASGAVSAIHIKHGMQNKQAVDVILPFLEKADPEKFIIFDVTVETAKYLKEKNSKLHLAPSVAHPYDIERYNSCVGGTLLPLEMALENKNLFDWVWLDEWDRVDKGGGTKKLYTEEVFKKIRGKGLGIGLITPELHSSSPGLLGSEKHSDAADKNILFERISEIISLKPDIICTDYPDEVKNMFAKN